MDLLVLVSMKNAAKRDISCELQKWIISFWTHIALWGIPQSILVWALFLSWNCICFSKKSNQIRLKHLISNLRSSRITRWT